MASAQTGEQFFVFLREDGVLCEDVEMKIEVSHDVCQTVDNGEALGPLFVKIDENPVPVIVIEQKAVGFSRDQTLFLLSQMSAKVDILFDGGKARSMAELRDRLSARRGGMKKFWLDVASTLSKAFSLIFDAEKVRRKWQTLCDGYKNYVDNHNKTGSARSKFEWKDQMEELLGERHDFAKFFKNGLLSLTKAQRIDLKRFRNEQRSQFLDQEHSMKSEGMINRQEVMC
ncbi:hypothetical protein CAPTEDRAFT_216034 [Capitella teleta]|uniref:Uncharacterized protein n=1 Tax=Capitella teleta TaxID=283909 RepID=R7TSC1_CAPTE|nr:hypothetical protein CAPTEDRAFT_216034 [Capitella teleta]|eukprot:ELT96502.1 hypothetical protein CAPTEDRAFT_216034 [Capitella teleta]